MRRKKGNEEEIQNFLFFVSLLHFSSTPHLSPANAATAPTVAPIQILPTLVRYVSISRTRVTERGRKGGVSVI
jgi:hypothetical protein